MTTASINIGENSSMSMGESPRQTRLTFDAANNRESIGRRIAGGRYREDQQGKKERAARSCHTTRTALTNRRTQRLNSVAAPVLT